MTVQTEASSRLNHLDAVRAFALLLGIVFHASLSFMPVFIGWAVMDVSTSPIVSRLVLVSHSFRMEAFFLIAGFFSCMAVHRNGVAEFLKSRFIRIVVPFVVGWFILRPLIVSGWIMGAASLRGDVDVAAGLIGGFKSFEALPAGIFTGSHLWFLYYLAMITVTAVVLRALVQKSGAWHRNLVRVVDVVLTRLGDSPLAVLVYAGPTAAVMWFMQGWGMDTPDRTLQPHIPVLLIYGGFFAFGWMLHRQGELLSRYARLTAVRGVILLGALVSTLLLAEIEADRGHSRYALAHAGFAASYSVMMWSFVFGTIGLFARLCRRPSRIVRYVADSSYWMYLIHLPVVVWLQVAWAELPVHWAIKLAGASGLTIAIALVTYDLFVRSTFIGRVLNGRHRPRLLLARRTKPPAPTLGHAAGVE